MSESLNGKPLANLREAIIALEKLEVKSPHGDIGRCLTLSRLRDLARTPQLTTFADSRHIAKCRKCTVRTHAMQRELRVDPRARFKKKASKLEHKCIRFADAKEIAHDLFDRLHDHCGESDHKTWNEIHSPVLALRRHHGHCEKEDAESIVAMTFAAAGSALSDAATPFARSLDAVWPIVVMVRNLSAEVARHGDECVAVRFADEYAAVVKSVPVPIRAALTYAVHGWTADSGQQTEGVNDLATVDRWIGELDERLRVQGDVSGIFSTIHKHVCTLMKPIFDAADPIAQLVQLLVTQHYLRRVVANIHDRLPHTVNSFHYLGDLAKVILRHAQHANHQYFVAIEALSAIGANQSIMQAMTELLDSPDDDLRRALFIYFTGIAERAQTPTPLRFIGEKNDWTFEGAPGHPAATFAARAVAMAKHDADIASLVEWSWLHLDPRANKVKKHVTRA